jgi:hypothetical protein
LLNRLAADVERLETSLAQQQRLGLEVGRRTLTVSKPVLKAPMVSELEVTM